MKKLIITVLVCTYIFGIVGMAEAALAAESISPKYSMTNNQKALFSFDLFALNANNSQNESLLNASNSWGSSLTPSLDSALDITTRQLSVPTVANPLTFTFTLSDTSNNNISNSGSAFHIHLYDSLADAESGTNPFAVFDTLTLLGASSASLSFTDNTYFPYLSDGKFVAVAYGSGVKTTGTPKTFTLNSASVSFNDEMKPVPLPTAGLLLASGLIGLIGARRKLAA